MSGKRFSFDTLPPRNRDEVAAQLKINLPGSGKTTKAPKSTIESNDTEPTTTIFVAFGLPHPVREFRFHPTRKWRFDYAWPQHKVALEVEGGAWTQGRHTRGAGFVGDMEKYNAAAELGWRLIRVTPDRLTSGETLDMLKAIFNHKP